jgi:hypothetical protein
LDSEILPILRNESSLTSTTNRFSFLLKHFDDYAMACFAVWRSGIHVKRDTS